jgi:hypothetical protein
MRVAFLINGRHEGGFPGEGIKHESSEIEVLHATSPLSVADYDLIVCSPLAFHEAGDFFFRRQREVNVALRNGKNVVLLVGEGTISNPQALHLLAHYMGKLNIHYDQIPSTQCVAVRPEFKAYCDLVGHARLVFPVGNFNVLLKAEDKPAGIALDLAQGTLFSLPFQLVPFDPPHWTMFFAVFLQAVRDYLNARAVTLPDWLASTNLPLEAPIAARIEQLRTELAEAQKRKEVFRQYKAILFAKGNALVDAVIETLSALIGDAGYTCTRIERFIEDFWIDGASGHTAIVDVTGTDTNARQAQTNEVVNHREQYLEAGETGITEDFPALLIVNTFAKSGSFHEKDKQLDQRVVSHAYASRVLIIRTLDLYRLLESKQLSKLAASDMESVLFNEAGWLRVDASGTYSVLK